MATTCSRGRGVTVAAGVEQRQGAAASTTTAITRICSAIAWPASDQRDSSATTSAHPPVNVMN